MRYNHEGCYFWMPGIGFPMMTSIYVCRYFGLFFKIGLTTFDEIDGGVEKLIIVKN